MHEAVGLEQLNNFQIRPDKYTTQYPPTKEIPHLDLRVGPEQVNSFLIRPDKYTTHRLKEIPLVEFRAALHCLCVINRPCPYMNLVKLTSQIVTGNVLVTGLLFPTRLTRFSNFFPFLVNQNMLLRKVGLNCKGWFIFLIVDYIFHIKIWKDDIFVQSKKIKRIDMIIIRTTLLCCHVELVKIVFFRTMYESYC